MSLINAINLLAVIESQLENRFFPLDHLTVLEVAGEDAGKFLQGQLTCNINELTTDKASFAAFCNAKGRVISTLMILKHNAVFQLILPASLLDKVKNKLQLYILRSKVQLHDQSQRVKLIGLTSPHQVDDSGLNDDLMAISLSPVPTIRLPSSTPRYLCLVAQDTVTSFTASLQQQGYSRGESNLWRYLDISSGIPWFELSQSELYTPQMLNIDKLGGISFNKGCYTGQEIVARTHFLGHSKRELVLAESDLVLADEMQQPDVLDMITSEKVGSILIKQSYQGKTRLLTVLQTVDAPAKHFILADAERTVLKPIPCQ